MKNKKTKPNYDLLDKNPDNWLGYGYPYPQTALRDGQMPLRNGQTP